MNAAVIAPSTTGLTSVRKRDRCPDCHLALTLHETAPHDTAQHETDRPGSDACRVAQERAELLASFRDRSVA